VTTHDFTTCRGYGHDYTFEPINGGQRGKVFGWGRGVRPGDYLILSNSDGSTRYVVDAIRYYPDPPDMWRAEVTFAPRSRSHYANERGA
jgi:hypothetical protein